MTNDDSSVDQDRILLGRRQYRRREVLLLGAAIPLVWTAPARAASPPTLVPVTSPGGPLPVEPPVLLPSPVAEQIAVGYWARGEAAVPAIMANAIGAGDPRLEKTGAALTINGKCSGTESRRLGLFVEFSPTGSGTTIAVSAWSASVVTPVSGSDVMNQSGGSAMFVAVGTGGTLNLSVDPGPTAAAPAASRNAVTLTTGDTHGAAKLLTGTYIVAPPDPATGQLPNLTEWGWIPVPGTHGSGSVVLGGTEGDDFPVLATFPYVIVDVQYGSPVGTSPIVS